MDVRQALTFIFKDEEWIKKVLLGIVISLVPIFGQFALMGYMLVIIRNVKSGDPRPLPDWSEAVQYFVEGLKMWVVNMVYSYNGDFGPGIEPPRLAVRPFSHAAIPRAAHPARRNRGYLGLLAL
jgi:hypothetical protein